MTNFSTAQKPAPVTGVSGAGLLTPSSRKSNFDLTGQKLVKRGAVVSWRGFRGQVSRVRMGTLYPVSGSPLHTVVGAFVDCNSVQVVA